MYHELRLSGPSTVLANSRYYLGARAMFVHLETNAPELSLIIRGHEELQGMSKIYFDLLVFPETRAAHVHF
jgi:hypothetical protein